LINLLILDHNFSTRNATKLIKGSKNSDSSLVSNENFSEKKCLSITLGNLSSLTLQQEMITAIQTGGSTVTCTPSFRGHSRSAATLGVITQPTLRKCNRSGLVLLKCWHYRCYVTLAAQQWMRVLMEARPVLHNARHRTR